MSQLKVCVVTGSRADYGLLYWPMRLLSEDQAFTLQVVATGMHLAPEFGCTIETIEGDGFEVDRRVPMLLSGDDAVSVAKSIGVGVIGFADALNQLRPDIALVLGDRFEILAAVQAALILRVPVAHLCGGDVTAGAFDDSIRHSISKMSHIHFATNESAARRLFQMGEDSAHVHMVGSPGLDHLRHVEMLGRDEVFAELEMEPRARNILVTFHPVTLGVEASVHQLDEVLTALDALGDEVGIVITGSNADTEGRELSRRAECFAAARGHVRFATSLGQRLYLNAMAHVDAVVGNSSSGLYEAPSLGVATVNIGDRQSGRLQAASVLNCVAERGAIRETIQAAFELDCDGVVNPYGDGRSSERIVEVLRTLGDPRHLLQKRFRDEENHG